MAFMKLHTEFGRWYLVETTNGTDIVSADVSGELGIPVGHTVHRDDDNVTAAEWRAIVVLLRDYIDVTHSPMQDVQSVECVEMWGARYSADGFLDCTDWVLGETEEEAEEECRAVYGDDEE